ncbi:MAG TPA: hypothetical protein IGS37_00030 [Synechococcales cyanobacterium M55_K2018_004]|nr:hypothetical protein [Synechococcales cyanobacterium M55_K2018_004]
MDLDQQLQDLIQHAPQDSVTPDAVEAIAPVLKLIAEQLKHPQYYVLQTLNQGWVMTTISHRTDPSRQKNIIYAFPALKDALASPFSRDPQVVALPVPVIHLLFQMIAIPQLDSVVFFEVPSNPNQGTEVTRDNLQALIQNSLQQSQGRGGIPSDIA